MKKFNYLFTLCAMLVGLTMNAQDNNNIGISETNDALAITANTALEKSIIIGANTVNAAGATAAIQNTGFGVGALDNLKQGDNNTAVGYNAGTAIGGAGGTPNTGQGNTLMGRASGYQIGAGDYNTAVGNQSATEIIGGDYNTFIGSGAKGDLGNAQGRIGIGQGVLVTSDLTAVIGKSTVTNVYFGGMAAGEWNATLHATGITLENSETITNASDGTVVVSGNLTVSSDMRLKDNIKSLGNTISEILKLDGKSYTRDGRNEIGLLAQDLELVYPELVSVDGNGMLAVNYQALAPVLINGVKDQEARIAKQEERIVKLEILVNLLLNGK
tara:strand:+ start:295 stop:1281 length:987 start_codon:yes stop_codon:yes gene_type:complete